MRAKVYRGLSGSQIASKAPRPLRDQVLLRRFECAEETFTLLVFPTQRQNTVLSGAVEHILSALPDEQRLVALGGCFTLEALALLKARGVEVYAQSEYPWTDAAWKELRTIVATGVKRPIT